MVKSNEISTCKGIGDVAGRDTVVNADKYVRSDRAAGQEGEAAAAGEEEEAATAAAAATSGAVRSAHTDFFAPNPVKNFDITKSIGSDRTGERVRSTSILFSIIHEQGVLVVSARL